MMDHLTNALLIDYLRRELPPEDDALVHAHLESCAACRNEYEIEVSLAEALRSAAAREELEFPSMIAAKVWEEIRTARPSPWARFTSFLQPAMAVPVAALLVLGIYFGSPFLTRHDDGPRIAATYYLEEHAAQQAENPLAEHGPASAQVIETSALDSGNVNELAERNDPMLAAASIFDALH
jgi:predicted anti-sigma-YlaC factor YlaD